MSSVVTRFGYLTGVAAALLLLGAGAVGLAHERGQTYADTRDMRAREEFRQSYRISPDGTIRVRGIAGPVSVETTDGGNTAEVHIVRMAASERELRCYRTDVRSSPGLLAIEHVQRDEDPDCESIRSRQEVHLRVPRSLDLDLSTIAGALDVGPVDGMVRAHSIAGRARFAQVRAAEIDSIAGGLTLGIAQVAEQGVRISSVVGPVDLNLERGIDADLSLDSVMGSVRSLVAGVDLDEDYGSYRARLGSGGRAVSLSSVVGPVRVRRP
ncbi:MAG: hypothetical protein M3177_07670 [Pseudomonadota bacterium]|nr:hypothetical protein [Pseudomonadota bacterium]